MRAQTLTLLAGGLLLLCPPAHAAAPQSHVAADVVEYTCTPEGGGPPQNIKVNVELTVPSTAPVGVQMTILWRASYAEGSQLLAPATGLPPTTTLYAYVGISDLPGFTSATGVGGVVTAAPGEVIPLQTTPVELKSTPGRPGTATVRPGAINFGPRPNEPLIQCEVQNKDALTGHTVIIGGGAPSTTPSAPPSSPPAPPSSPSVPPSTEVIPTRTVTETVTPAVTSAVTEPGTTGRIERTPRGGVATGGGGEAGPDARLFLLYGALLTLAATLGLLLRRRAAPR